MTQSRSVYTYRYVVYCLYVYTVVITNYSLKKRFQSSECH